MKRYVLNISDLQDIAPQFKSESGTKILKYLFNLCKINEINALYDRSCDYRGAAFCNSIIDDLDITCFHHGLESPVRSARWRYSH